MCLRIRNLSVRELSMDGWIKNTGHNSVWKTNQVLICVNCQKKQSSLYEIKRENINERWCRNCFFQNADLIFGMDDFITMRLVEKVELKQSQKAKKKIRSQVTKSLRYDVLSKANFKCQSCGVSASNAVLVIDHIKPVHTGGTSDISNLQALCTDCNQGKGGKS